MKKIAVIIPVHNGLEYTKKCLIWLYESIANTHQPGGIRIILVDDGSDDGTAGWVKENYPEVSVLKGDGNLWWSGAVNLGAKYALTALKCDYVLLWNNDIKPDKDYFCNIMNITENLNKNVIAGSKIYFLDRPNVICAMGGIFEPRTGNDQMIGSNQIDCEKYEKVISADWCSGMGTLIHKSIFEKIGFWDENEFPQYAGDSDFTLRAKKAGIRLLIYPTLKIYNDHKHTGEFHNGSFRLLIKSLVSLKSPNNIAKNLNFYKRHAESRVAYLSLIKQYLGYIGGFFKWKTLGIFGIKKIVISTN